MAVRAFFRSPRPPGWGPELVLDRLAQEDGPTFCVIGWLQEILEEPCRQAGIEVGGDLHRKCAVQMQRDLSRFKREVPGFGIAWAARREVTQVSEIHKLTHAGQKLEDLPGNGDVVQRWIEAFVANGGDETSAAAAVGLSRRTVSNRRTMSHQSYDPEWVEAQRYARDELNARDLRRYESGIAAAEKDGDHRVVLQAIARRLEANNPDWKKRGIEVNLNQRSGLDDRTAALVEAQQAQQRHFLALQERQLALAAAPEEKRVIDVKAMAREEVM